ncbi:MULTISPECIES: dipeptide ABC transporter ATP-binding protein [unclassified Pseudomonas]|uniref:ABC transporter ATP-binding protein n=1 Tax=unclassified Pseudomonas TaxID=196821 RepID=UPI00244888AF|nr:MULTISPECIES: dipeptide ABC transporter ATP-binding protein [unclassified Pseudomonas]MDG9930809.1 dipeptide ABC transporter ATP-binding protein [Pseudomonas sp. GD04042]MDH0485198.1 dipeptide ABC transporter ATP-binding protein [Pseudomonas sp. GD04015]MDH0605568.1 dipeptide ABC transporter ATP-binding protein [Pseudomonas sp. GD03869]
MSDDVLRLDNLCIDLGRRRVVDGLDLRVRPGERLALVGESGSGKTVSALSILGLLPPQARVSGSIRLAGEELLGAGEARLREVRGGEVAMVFQEPMSALNPLFTIGDQIIETLRQHEGLGAREARARTIALLERTGLREPERRVDSYPHQLSGGQLQRAVIAMALACRPRLLIADEPTTALDMTIRARIVQLLLDLQQEFGMAILLITHDLNLVRRFAQRVAVMEQGQLVETAETERLFAAPRHPYTRRLLDSLPRREITTVDPAAPILLETRRLRVEYPKKRPGWRGWFGHERFVALAGADVRLRAGETVGIVGESGSGKSTLAQAILGLIATQGGELDYAGAPSRQPRALRAWLQVVFQDPFGSLSPRQTIEQIVGEGLALHYPQLDRDERRRRIHAVLEEVGLPPAALSRYPHEFSGGQRQRIAIARALVLRPQVVVLDEPTSALDVSIQQQVLQLLVGLQRKYGLSYVLISHDLAVVNALAHRLYVLKDGEIVETGDTGQVIRAPQHPYTQRLVQASL